MSNLLLIIPTSSNNGRLPRIRVPRLRVPRLPRPLQSSSLHQPVRPLLSTCSTTTARSVCAHQVLYMLVRYAQSTRNVARILRVLSQNSRHISCLLDFSGFSCTPTCTCSTPTCALRVRHYINLYDERYAPYGLKTTEKIHEFWLKNQPA